MSDQSPVNRDASVQLGKASGTLEEEQLYTAWKLSKALKAYLKAEAIELV